MIASLLLHLKLNSTSFQCVLFVRQNTVIIVQNIQWCIVNDFFLFLDTVDMQLIPLNGIKTTFKLRILTHLVNSGELQGVGGMTKIIRPTKEFIKCTFRSQRSHLYPFISQHYFNSHWSSYAILGDECCTNIIFLLSCDLRFSKHICKRNAIYYSLCLCDYCHQCSSYIFSFS